MTAGARTRTGQWQIVCKGEFGCDRHAGFSFCVLCVQICVVLKAMFYNLSLHVLNELIEALEEVGAVLFGEGFGATGHDAHVAELFAEVAVG